MSTSEPERGQSLPLMLLAMAVAVAVVVLVGLLGGRAVAEARARTAADAAALAGAAEGRGAAEAVAGDNGATLVDYVESGPQVRVEVAVGTGHRRAHAVAAAERTSEPPRSPGTPTTGLTPEMQAAVARAEALLGEPVPIVSGWRSSDQQRWLWANRATNPYPVAPPGTSMHERGLAIDVPRWFVDRLLAVAAAAGLCHPLPTTDPIHFVLC